MWIYEFPLENVSIQLIQDSKGTIWSLYNVFNNSEFAYSSLKYYQNSTWNTFDVSEISDYIMTLNADDEMVYIGTTNGLVEKDCSFTAQGR